MEIMSTIESLYFNITYLYFLLDQSYKLKRLKKSKRDIFFPELLVHYSYQAC
jgi:hypothetical protein